MNKIYTSGTRFVDEFGRERIFNGINIVDKTYYEGTEKKFNKSWNEKTFIQLKEKGFNVVRLGFTWCAIEPEMGKYSEKYIDLMAEFVSLCEKYDIYFYLDCHQDLYANVKKMGDGAPRWAVIDDNEKWQKPIAIWAEGYFYGKGVMNSFENFWRNTPIEGIGIIDRYTNMWKHLAKRFANSPAFLGFDVLNEPYPGKDGEKVFQTIVESAVRLTSDDAKMQYNELNLAEIFQTGSRLEFVKMIKLVSKYFLNKKWRKAFFKRFNSEDGFHEFVNEALPYIQKFDVEYYTPFMNKVTEGIREVTDKGIIFMENSYFSNLGIPYSAEAVTVSGVREKELAFAPHGYDIFVDSPLYNYASNERVASIFKQHQISQTRLDVPVLVGEFGGGAKGTKWLTHLDYLLDMFDNNKWSSTYWCFYKNKFFKSKEIYHLSRPYPHAVCGEIIRFSYNQKGRRFHSFL